MLGLLLAGLLMLGLLTGCGSKPAEKKDEAPKAWVPTREIEFVVPSAPGGGSDLNARVISDFAKRTNFHPKASWW